MLFNENFIFFSFFYQSSDGCKEIHPCVLQDIGPLGPLPKKVQSYHRFLAIHYQEIRNEPARNYSRILPKISEKKNIKKTRFTDII